MIYTGTGFTELVESVFHTPNDLSYTQSGMLMGVRIVTAGRRFEVSDSEFKHSLQLGTQLLKNYVTTFIWLQ